MAASNNSPISIPATPPSSQISKDIPEPDGLSPQWLLPKPGDNKTGMSQGENRPRPFIGYGDRPGNGDDMHGNQRKKDVFRPTVLNAESGRHDRWRDEERVTNPLARRDRWREGEKEIGDGRKTERWVDNSFTRHHGESRRPPSDRWADSSRENNYEQLRENKWNTRWGSDKDVDKGTDGGKLVDMPHDKGLPHVVSHVKSEAGDNYQPWRPSSLQGRGKAEQPLHQAQATSKEGPTFGHERGHALTFSVGRGRSYGSVGVNNYSNNSQSAGLDFYRDDNRCGEPSPFKYSRTNLLDVYRFTDIKSSNKILDVLMQVSSLTQEEPLEPLALSALTVEESAILKGIDNGEVVSSGAPQISKDGPTGQSSNDFSQTRRIKHGSRDDVSIFSDDTSNKVDYCKGTYSKVSEALSHEKQMNSYGSHVTIDDKQFYGENRRVSDARDDVNTLKKADEVTDKRDSGIQGNVYAQSPTPWRSPSVEKLANTHSRDRLDTRKDNSMEGGNVLPDSSKAHNDPRWQSGVDSAVRKHPAVVDWEQESRRILHPSPEDLLLYYKDPQDQIQGPFTGSDIIGWFEAGYFGIDLQVRLVNAPNETPFSSLGNVMPHLRAKARPPPGFNSANQTEVPQVSSRSSLTGFGKVLPSPSGVTFLGNENKRTHGSSTEAENRFIESLMSADVSNSLGRFGTPEGLQGFGAQTSGSMAPLGTEGGEALNLLAHSLNQEQQKSLTQPYTYWPTRDGTPVVPIPDISSNANMPQVNLLSTVGDMSRQSVSPNVEMMSILQGLSERSPGGMNNSLGIWPNFSVQGGIDPFKDNKSDLYNGQSFPQVAYGLQQHKLQPQNTPQLPTLHTQQTLDNPSLLPDKILQSVLTQNPQTLNILQQQLLLQQLQSQQSAPGLQLSLLDQILLIKQQQKQEEQQQLLRQQQQLLSQVLSEKQLAQRLGDPTFGQSQASPPLVRTAPIDLSVPQPSPSMFQISSQTSVSGINPDDRRISSVANMPPKLPHYLDHTVPTDSSSLPLPHQMLGILQQNVPCMPLPAHVDIPENNNSSLPKMMENLATSEALERPQSTVVTENSCYESREASSPGQVLLSSVVDSGQSVLSVDPAPLKLPESSACDISVRAQDNEILMFERTNDAKVTLAGGLNETSVKALAVKEANIVEAREVKKTSDKKSRKLKASKAQPSQESLKGASKGSAQKAKQSEAEGACVAVKAEEFVATEGSLDQRLMEIAGDFSNPPANDLSTPPYVQSEIITEQNVQVNSAQRAWKPAVSVKPKSLLEIQQEEQKKAQMEAHASSISASVNVNPLSSSTHWSGVDTHAELKVSKDIRQDGFSSEHKTESSKSKRSGLHDLLAAEVLAKSSDRSIEVEDASSLPPLPTLSNQRDLIDDNFIEAKDTRKSRKKAAKAKAAGAKNSTAVSSIDVTVASSPVEKGKSSKNVQAVKEVLPAPPSGASLGDFVPWKGESTIPSSSPAWSSDSGKFSKHASLRDILKEEEKKVTPAQQHPQIATPKKSQSSQAHSGSWSVSASSPSNATSLAHIHSQHSSQSKSKGGEDLFWGPPEQNKQEINQEVFPQLGNQGNWATRSTPSKATPGATRQKSTGGRAVDNYVIPSPPSSQASAKGKRDGSTKHSEAMDFRSWCESESVRLTGSKDTSFLEFCLKQSRSEAQTLLIENLGSFDPNHEFIEKFLNYMELLSTDVLELAFQSRNDLKAYNNGAKDMNSDNVGFADFNRDGVASADGSIKEGKKKGKKGKKVSPSVLGFNVVSNRIMMGEIQTVED